MKWTIMIISRVLSAHVAFAGIAGPLANNDADIKWFETYAQAADESKLLVHMLEPLDITQVRLISDVFMSEGA